MLSRRSGRLAGQKIPDYASEGFVNTIKAAKESRYVFAVDIGDSADHLAQNLKQTLDGTDGEALSVPPSSALSSVRSKRRRVIEDSDDEAPPSSLPSARAKPARVLQESIGEEATPPRSPSQSEHASQPVSKSMKLASDAKKIYKTQTLKCADSVLTDAGSLIVRAVIAVSRKSGRITGSQQHRTRTLSDLHERNGQLYQLFQQHVHPTLHRDCKAACQDEFFSIVLDGISSNENIADFNHPGLRNLRDILTSLQHEAGSIHIAFFGKDGLTTNLNGISRFFGSLYNVTAFWIMLYLGPNIVKLYKMTAIIHAIRHCEAYGLRDGLASDEYALVADWYSIMFDKEQIAVSARDLKSVMPIQRNKVAISMEDNMRPKAITPVDYSALGRAKRMSEGTREGMARKGKLITPYELRHVDGSTDLHCVLDDCQSTVRDFDALLDHVFQHGREAGRCALCPNDNQHDSGRNVHFKGVTATKLTMAHLLRHLPPQIECPECRAPFATLYNLEMHMETHTGKALEKKNIDCPYCDCTFYSNRELDVHVGDKHDAAAGKVRSFTCKHGCGMAFVNSDTRSSHEDKYCENRPCDVLKMHVCPEDGCRMEFPDRGQMVEHLHSVHIRSAEVRSILLQVGVDAPSLVGSTVVRSRIEGADEHREKDRRGMGGLMGWYDREMA